jgi:hypothetical protein
MNELLFLLKHEDQILVCLLERQTLVVYYPLYDILVDLLNQNLLDEQEEFFLVALDFLQAVFFAAIQSELNDPE